MCRRVNTYKKQCKRARNNVRKNIEKTKRGQRKGTRDAGSQNRCGRVGRGTPTLFTSFSTPPPTPLTRSTNPRERHLKTAISKLSNSSVTDQRTNGQMDKRTNEPTDGLTNHVKESLVRDISRSRLDLR